MAKAESTVEGLRDVFRCFICMERLQDARLCPHCSKFCCFHCIRRWLTEQRPQCPHCRCSLRVSELVKCRWAEEVTTKLDTLDSSAVSSQSEPDNCNVHQEKLSVFCWTCQACICHHCALWGGNHSGHTLKPLEDEYNHRVNQISQEVRKLRRRLCLLISTLQDLEKNMEKIRERKEDRVREIRCAVEMMMSRLDSAMKEKLVNLGAQKRSLSMEVEMVEGVVTEVEHQLATATHSNLVKGSTELFRMLSQIQRSDPPSPALVPATFESEIVPEFQSCIFVIQPYSELRGKADAVYSPGLLVNGLTWRLKVYPDGNGVVRGNYLSVFLELTHGPPGQAKYEYRVEMCQQRTQRDSGRTENIVREFASDFEVGECWGYNRFYKIEYLDREGFLDRDDDSLVMQFQIRPPTFFQKSKDMAWQIEELESRQARNESEINDLKESLAAAIERPPAPQQSSSQGMMDEADEFEDASEMSKAVQPDVTLDSEPEESVVAAGTDELKVPAVTKDNQSANTSDQEFGGSFNLMNLSERDVEEQRRESLENDVEDEFVAVGGLREALEEMNLSLPDRENMDLLGDWPQASVATEQHRGGAVQRLQEAFRSLPEEESEDGELGQWDIPLDLAVGGRYLQCPACSPQRKKFSVDRKVRSRHCNLLRDEGFLLGRRNAVRSDVRSQDSSFEDEARNGAGRINETEMARMRTETSRSSSLDVLCGEDLGSVNQDSS